MIPRESKDLQECYSLLFTFTEIIVQIIFGLRLVVYFLLQREEIASKAGKVACVGSISDRTQT